MIPDRIFKDLEHSYKGFDKYLNGQRLEIGYKPDYVLKKNKEYIIMESETGSNRKMYVGGMMKAAHYLQNEKKGKLIFVIKPQDNTKVSSIAKHLKPYFLWIKKISNLEAVYVIDSEIYYTNEKLLTLDCNEFETKALKV